MTKPFKTVKEFLKDKQKLVFDKVNNRVVTEDDSKNAFYTDEFDTDDCYCEDEVVNNVVKMFNEGKDLMEIDAYLLDEGKCTQEAREEIVEGLFLIYYPNGR